MEGISVSPVSTCFVLIAQTRELRTQPLCERAEATRTLEVSVYQRRGMERNFPGHGYIRRVNAMLFSVRRKDWLEGSGGCLSPRDTAARPARCLQTTFGARVRGRHALRSRTPTPSFSSRKVGFICLNLKERVRTPGLSSQNETTFQVNELAKAPFCSCH